MREKRKVPRHVLPSPRGTRRRGAEGGRSEIRAEESDGRSEQMEARYVLRVLGEEGGGAEAEAGPPIISGGCRSASGKSSRRRFQVSSRAVCWNVR